MKLTKEQYLLSCLSEECAETIQRVTKILRFGMNEVQEGQLLTNAERLAYEFNDILGVMTVLCNITNIPDIADDKQIEKKAEKLVKYMEYSASIGILEDEN